MKQMRTGMPVRFKTAQGDVRLEGCLIECGADGRATRCELVRRRSKSEHGEERNERQVPEQDEPRGERVELERQLPVAAYGNHSWVSTSARASTPVAARPRPADERHERDQPEQELRRAPCRRR